MLERTPERDTRLCFALFAWFSREARLAGIAKPATGKACNEYKQNTCSVDTGLCLNQRSETYGSRARCGSFDDGIWLA